MVAKHGDRTPPTCSGSTTMIDPWYAGSVAPKTMTNYPNLTYFRNSTLRTLRQSDGHHAMHAIKSVTDLSIPGTRRREKPKNVIRIYDDWCQTMWLVWRRPTRQRGMESQCLVKLQTPPNETWTAPWYQNGYDSMGYGCIIIIMIMIIIVIIILVVVLSPMLLWRILSLSLSYF